MQTANEYRFDYIINDHGMYNKLLRSFQQEVPKVFVDRFSKIVKEIKIPKEIPIGGRWMEILTWTVLRFEEVTNGAESVQLTKPEKPYIVLSAEGNPEAIPHLTTEDRRFTVPVTTKIENRTYINGNNAADMSDDALFSHIAAIEAEAASLSKLNTACESMNARIQQLEDDAKALAEYIDNR